MASTRSKHTRGRRRPAGKRTRRAHAQASAAVASARAACACAADARRHLLCHGTYQSGCCRSQQRTQSTPRHLLRVSHHARHTPDGMPIIPVVKVKCCVCAWSREVSAQSPVFSTLTRHRDGPQCGQSPAIRVQPSESPFRHTTSRVTRSSRNQILVKRFCRLPNASHYWSREPPK